jgi:glycosyltransferase involved in cell wall biosynthesis
MRILWVSDSPDSPSGFGNVTRFVCRGLALRGFDVHILGWQHRAPAEWGREWEGCRVYGIASDPVGSDALLPLLVRIRPDIVITLANVWWLAYFGAPDVRRQMELIDCPWLLYFPIEGDIGSDRLPPSWIETLKAADFPVAMSHYGKRVAENCGVSCEYIPHGVELDVFSPPYDRLTAKRKVGYAGKFVILSDSRNQPRKMLPRLLDVFARFSKGRPDALLHLHTDPDDHLARSAGYSYDIRADIEYLGIGSQVRFSVGFRAKRGKGLPLEELAAYYQAADIHVLASSGEGFGLPTLQAAATGAVPIACAYSASQELTEGHGSPLPVAEWTKDGFGMRGALINIDAAVSVLAHYYENRDLLRQRGVRARQFAESYGWNAVIDQWERLLQRIGGARQRIRRVPETRVQHLSDMLSRNGVGPTAGISVSDKVVDYGRLASSILADIQCGHSDVRIPVLPPACKVRAISVPREAGYVGFAGSDRGVFERLRRIFPSLHGWIPVEQPFSDAPPGGAAWRPLGCPAEARYDLARSILLLNVSATMPECTLVDAALYGVPCVGSLKSSAQGMLWPDLVADDEESAVAKARDLLTNAARLRRLTEYARAQCTQHFTPNEEDSEVWLRQLHAAYAGE